MVFLTWISDFIYFSKFVAYLLKKFLFWNYFPVKISLTIHGQIRYNK